ncbi:Imm21 family immunity protein [Nonomuraea sp. NPDC049625]|uniref:Imm21 family immunity protein n=1 Tax=Nonomuraea sp. NPDC049625 TaxID=3155775 RepID=UPI0034475A4D
MEEPDNGVLRSRPRSSVLHTWVSTAGGPLIAIPQSELNTWAGVNDNDGPVETWGDYGRACAVEGYIGTVTVGARQALVLGDDLSPGRTPRLCRS